MVIVFRGGIGSAKRVVVKLGTSSVVDSEGVFDYKTIDSLVQQMVASQKEYVVVSSGAIRLGNVALGWNPSKELVKKQVAATVGQPLLISAYQQILEKYDLFVGQSLLSRFDTPEHDYNAKNTLEHSLQHNILPIINENDAVSTEEITFGDNDLLAARKAKLIGADLLVLLSADEGIYDSFYSEGRVLLSYLENPSVVQFMDGKSKDGTGGVHSKIKAAQYAAGIPVVVAPARKESVLFRIFAGESMGTLLYCSEKQCLEK